MEQNGQPSGIQVEGLPQYVDGPLETQQLPPPPPYQSLPSPHSTIEKGNAQYQSTPEGSQHVEISHSFKGYEDGMRERLEVDAENQPTISLWSTFKTMVVADFTKFSLPASYNQPLSQLQRCAEDLEYADLLDTAAEQKDSAWRMVYVAAFAYSKYASSTGVYNKPFNPLLGETYEYVRPDKNYRFLAEQVSHHIPNSAVWAESSNWTYHGESVTKSNIYFKSFNIVPSGTWFLKLRLPSGFRELYTWKKPVVSVTLSAISGSPTFENYGPMEIKNWTTGEICVMDSLKVSPECQFNGSVKDSSGQARITLGGRMNSKIYAQMTPGHEVPLEKPNHDEWDRKNTSDLSQASVVWEADQLPSRTPYNLTPFLITLNDIPDKLRVYLPPTDTRFRLDQRAVEQNQYDWAAAEKIRLEEKQREGKRKREAACEAFVPRWFKRAKCDITGESYCDFDGSYWKERASGDGERWKGIEDIFGNAVPTM